MNPKTNILITGANGFIGSYLMKRFSAGKNYRVTGLVRKTSDLFRLKGNAYNLVYGSISEPAGLKEVMKDIDCVIHTAGKASDWGNYEDFYHTNVEGTVNVVESALRCGVKRLIHFSSTVVYGFTGHRNTDETRKPHPFHNHYCITKTIAEERVFNFKDRIELIVLRPSNVYGPLDLSFTFPLLRSIDRGLIGFVNGGRAITSPCFVKNLVSATERAVITQKGIGEAYNISDGNDITWKLFLQIIAEKLGRKAPRLCIPAAPLKITAHLLSMIYRLLKSPAPPLITPYRIAISSKDYSFSIDKARKLLTYKPEFTTDHGLDECIRWYREYKYS